MSFLNPAIFPTVEDEVGAAGALGGAPVEIVKAKTVDAYAMANAEYVIEGYIVPNQRVWETEEAERLGQQGVASFHPEWARYMGRAYRARRFEVTAFTHRRDKPITALRDRLDVTRAFRRVAQRLAQLDDHLGHRVVAHHYARPYRAEQRFPAHHLAGALRQIDEDGHRLRLELHRLARGRKLVQRCIHGPVADLQALRASGGFGLQRLELSGIRNPSPKLSRFFGTRGVRPGFNCRADPPHGGDMKIRQALIPGVFVSALLIQSSFAHDDPPQTTGKAPEQLGSVRFPTSCDPKVQARFERGVALLHSFWFPEGRKAFLEVLEADPSCAIAYWGLGVNRLLNPFGGQPQEKVLLEGQAAVDKGLAAPTRITTADGETIETRDPAPLLATLASEGKLDGISVRTGTLEDVFLARTGREYRA